MRRHDPHEPLTGRDDAGTVRPDDAHLPLCRIAAQEALHAHHVLAGNTVCHANCGADTGICSFHNRVGGKRGWHEDQRGFCPHLFHSFTHGVEQRAVKHAFAALAGGHAAHDIGAVLDHISGVERADAP